MKQLPASEFDEQLYVNAELGFTIKHPLNWQRKIIDVLSPTYQQKTVYWDIPDSNGGGEMSVQSLPQKTGFLSHRPETFQQTHPMVKIEQAFPFQHTAGQAIKLIGEDSEGPFWMIFIAGTHNDLIMTLTYQQGSIETMTDLFNGIVMSLRELEPGGIGPLE